MNFHLMSAVKHLRVTDEHKKTVRPIFIYPRI